MRNLEKYKGVIPAFYACYDKEGNISPEGVQVLSSKLNTASSVTLKQVFYSA